MISVMGIAGSGKSTQADLLVKALDCPRIYTGELLRQYANGEARIQLDAGEVVDDKFTIPLLEEEMDRVDAWHKESVLDGSPRSMDQAEWLARLIEKKRLKSFRLVHLVLDKAVARQRLIDRGRSDDNEAAINQRFHEYQTRMQPILQYLRKHNLPVLDVDAAGSVGEVHKAVMESLNETQN